MSPEAEVQQSARELLEQKRASFAYKAVDDGRAKSKRQQEEYATLVKNLAASILHNGLGQTVAFLMSKAEGQASSAHGLLLTQMATWLVRDNILSDPGIDIAATERLMQALLSNQTTRQQWRQAEQEAVELAIWLKRFAEAFIPKVKPGKEDTDGEGSAESSAKETKISDRQVIR